MHGGMWGNMVEKLAEQFCVYAVDLPGHGSSTKKSLFGLNLSKSENTDGLRFDRLTANGSNHYLDYFVDQLTGQFTMPLTVCGWSLGGQIALRWAAREPLKVQHLILVASTPCFVRREDWPCAMAAETLAGFAAALTENYAQTLRRFLALQVRGSDKERELLVSLRAALFSRGEPDLAALQAGLEILRDCDLRDSLTSITQPTLVIAGERDTLTPPDASRYMADKMPQARLVEIPGAAHAPFLSHPEIFVEQVKSFLHERI
jgi:pimeloyl-[acyl-carrier protein] methyl ester esterase